MKKLLLLLLLLAPLTTLHAMFNDSEDEFEFFGAGDLNQLGEVLSPTECDDPYEYISVPTQSIKQTEIKPVSSR